MNRSRRLFGILNVLVALISVLFTSPARADVKDVLNGLGPVVFNGSIEWVGGEKDQLAVFWVNNSPSVYLNGSLVTDYSNLSLDASGNLVIETSIKGFNNVEVRMNPANRMLVNAKKCQCWGGDKSSVKRLCTKAQCDATAHNCVTTGSAAYCEHHGTGTTR